MTEPIDTIVGRLKHAFGVAEDGDAELDSGGFADLLDDDATITVQGTSWPIGGTHVGKDAANRFFQTIGRVWEHVEFEHVNFATNDTQIMVEWFSHVTNWRGETIPNRGATMFEIKDGKIWHWREYTDTEHMAEFFAGWQEHVGAEIGQELPNWKVAVV